MSQRSRFALPRGLLKMWSEILFFLFTEFVSTANLLCVWREQQLAKNYNNSNFIYVYEDHKKLLPASADALYVSNETYAGFSGVDNLIIGTMCKGFAESTFNECVWCSDNYLMKTALEPWKPLWVIFSTFFCTGAVMFISKWWSRTQKGFLIPLFWYWNICEC